MTGSAPMMRQYLEIKTDYPDSILIFPFGRFLRTVSQRCRKSLPYTRHSPDLPQQKIQKALMSPCAEFPIIHRLLI